ncbi:hypothetical protein P3T23_009845 [Paraburkholderia sp. GAS448]|jgi:hypothetical protein|uniref:hypothetical protein n=1 Tax=Paraburkholderia sp. GAS448 TaxID=3035136 RepID=UPI003D1D480F
MGTQEEFELHRALSLFVSLNESSQKSFISAINAYLLASAKSRRQLVEQWKFEHDQQPAD